MKWTTYTTSFGQTPAHQPAVIYDEANDPFGVARTTTRRARHAKILGWQFIDADVCVYTDNTIEPLPSMVPLVEGFYGSGADIAFYPHRCRDCLYDEAQAVVSFCLDAPLHAYAQTSRYRDKGHPAHWGLYETGFMFLRPSERLQTLCEWWWQEVEAGSHRDQISLPFVLRLLKTNIHSLRGGHQAANCYTLMHRTVQDRKHRNPARLLSWL